MAQADFRKAKSTWMRPSLNPMGPAALAAPNAAGRVRAPWEVQSDELVADFENNLLLIGNEVKHPWDHDSYDLQLRDLERRKAEEYKYESLFEVPPLSEAKQRQLANYHIDPPFNCAYNARSEPSKAAKKLNPDKNPVTRSPWTYGELPAQPVARKIQQRPSTALWDVPKGDESAVPEMAVSGDPVLDSLRSQLRAHGAAGIAGLSRKFRIMDDSGDGKLDMNEFCKGMKECKVADLSDKALKHLFRYFDRDDSGTINYDEFLVGIRGVLNPRRKALVALAFKVLDADGSGAVELSDIEGRYNARAHPDVVAGKRTEREILREFALAFEVGIHKDGVVTPKEFEDYYSNLSASVDDDDYFELMIRNAWHISGGEGWCANTTNRRVLVKHSDGRETVEEIKDDLGLRAGDTEAMVRRLQAQGHDVSQINLNGRTDMKNQIDVRDLPPRLSAPKASAVGGGTGAGRGSLANAMASERRASNDRTLLGARGKPVSLGASVGY